MSSSCVKRPLRPSGTLPTSVVVATKILEPAMISFMDDTILSAVRTSICRISSAQHSGPQLMARSARDVRNPSVFTSLAAGPYLVEDIVRIDNERVEPEIRASLCGRGCLADVPLA